MSATMDYANLLAIHPTHDSLAQLDPMVGLARFFDASLHVVVLNHAAPLPTMTLLREPEYDWGQAFRTQLRETSEHESAVREYLLDRYDRYHVSVDCEPMGMISDVIGQKALYSDLVLCSRGLESPNSGITSRATEGALFNAGRPVIVLSPNIDTAPRLTEKITVAWDETPQAARAVTAALPLLRNAGTVDVLVVWGKEGEEAAHGRATRLQTWLRTHSIKAKAQTVSSDGQLVSHALVDAINSTGSSLVVMGAYGHARISERLFAGATYSTLSAATVSLFMAH